MGTKIVEGLIEEIGSGTVTNGEINRYSFVKIGGVRHPNIVCNNYMDSLIKVGRTVCLSCATKGSDTIVIAIQEPDGTITKLSLKEVIGVGILKGSIALLVAIVPAMFLMALHSEITGWTVAVLAPIVFGYFSIASALMARNALDGKPAPIVSAKT